MSTTLIPTNGMVKIRPNSAYWAVVIAQKSYEKSATRNTQTNMQKMHYDIDSIQERTHSERPSFQ